MDPGGFCRGARPQTRRPGGNEDTRRVWMRRKQRGKGGWGAGGARGGEIRSFKRGKHEERPAEDLVHERGGHEEKLHPKSTGESRGQKGTGIGNSVKPGGGSCRRGKHEERPPKDLVHERGGHVEKLHPKDMGESRGQKGTGMGHAGKRLAPGGGGSKAQRNTQREGVRVKVRPARGCAPPGALAPLTGPGARALVPGH